MQINKKFVHQFGDQPSLYYDAARSTNHQDFLGASTNLRKATISFVRSVRLSVRIEKLVSHLKDFHEISYLRSFRKSVEKIQVSIKSEKNNSGILHEDRCTFLIISRSVLLGIRNVSDKHFRENHNTFCDKYFFRKSCRL